VSRHFKIPSPKIVEIGGVKWRENYNCYIVKLGGVIELSFAYSKGLYDARAIGQEIGTADTVEVAAQMCIAEARRIYKALGERLAQIPEVKL
jgi:hypothetical protein